MSFTDTRRAACRAAARARGGWTLVFLFLLVACGSRPASYAPVPVLTPVPVIPGATESSGALLVLGRYVGDDGAEMASLLEEFEARSGIAVRYEGSGEVADRLRELIDEGDPPGVVLLPKPNWLRELASAAAIPPLDEQASAAVRANFAPGWVELVSYDDMLYGVPFDASAKSLLWYRPAALREAGSETLDTLDALKAIAASLEREGQTAFAVAGEPGWTLTDWFENVLLAASGVDVYDALVDHRIAWTDPRVQRAAEQFAHLLQDEWVWGGIEGALSTPLRQESFDRAFSPERPQAAFWLGQANMARASGFEPEIEYDVTLFPTGGTVINVGSVAVAADNSAEAMALLTYLAEPTAVESWVERGGFISPNLNIALERYPDAIARHEAELIVRAESLRFDLSDLLPPNLGQAFLYEQLTAMLRDPTRVPVILEEIERVATREQGSVPAAR